MEIIEARVPILLIDDRPANLLSLAAVLESSGYELIQALSGQEALRAVEQHDFAVVLLDVVMPVMSGLETLRAMRALRKNGPPTPVIFVTGLETSEEDVAEAYAIGAVDFVQKPLKPLVLQSKVATFAELYRARTRAALQQHAEAALHASEQWMRQLIHAVTDYALFMLDEKGLVASWNPGVERIKGYAQEEILGRHFSVFYTPEDIAAERPERVLEAVRRAGRFEDEGWRVRKDGSRFWANVVITALRDQSGKLLGFGKVTRDLTEKRAAQEAHWKLLQERTARAISETERERLRLLLVKLPASVTFLRGRDLVVEFANERTLANLAGRDIVGKPLRVAMPELVEQPYYERIRSVFESGEPFAQHEALAWAELGGERIESYWDSVYLPLRDASGTIEGVMLFDLDVTSTVRARQELERVNRAKDEFLATMSHELRTPLNAIAGWASILQRKPRSETTLDRGLETIERNAKTQTKLVNDLLDVSRVITGKLRLALVRSEMFPLMIAAADAVRPAADAKGVRLALDVDPGIGAMSVDPDRIQQILWNLLTNAVRFTPRDGRVTLEAKRIGMEVVIGVRDTGAGVAPEHIPHLFDRFVQIDSSATRSHAGLGLGLAIVRHLAEAHGGSARAASEGLGRGSTFQVALPIQKVDESFPHPTEAIGIPSDEKEPGASTSVATRLDDVHVLVVEDDVDSAEVLCAVLQRAGAVATLAKSAQDAFEALASWPQFDVIVSDVRLPDVDGYTMMREIRAGKSGARIPAIALTAYARPDDAVQALEAGFQEHMAKPLQEQRLLAAIWAWSRKSEPACVRPAPV